MSSYVEKCKIKFLNIKGEDVPDEVYFRQRPGYLSNSGIGLINPYQDFGVDYGAGSPELYKNRPKFKSVSLDLGSAVHCKILQPDEFEISDYRGKPSGKCGKFVDAVLKFRKKGEKLVDAIEHASQEAEYYVGKLSPKILRKAMADGLEYYLKRVHGDFDHPTKEIIVLPDKMLYTAQKCIKAFYRNPAIHDIIKENIFEPKILLNEIALYSDMMVTLPDGKEVPLKFKGKLDSVVIDPEGRTIYLNDIKTTSSSVDYFMGRLIDGEWYNGSFEHHCYYRQLYVYFLMLQMYCEQVLGYDMAEWTLKANIFCLETTGENRARCIPISQGYIDMGKDEFKELICRIAYHETYGYDSNFPG